MHKLLFTLLLSFKVITMFGQSKPVKASNTSFKIDSVIVASDLSSIRSVWEKQNDSIDFNHHLQHYFSEQFIKQDFTEKTTKIYYFILNRFAYAKSSKRETSANDSLFFDGYFALAEMDSLQPYFHFQSKAGWNKKLPVMQSISYYLEKMCANALHSFADYVASDTLLPKQNQIPRIKVEKRILYNSFSVGDSIPCLQSTFLQKEDFQLNTKKENNSAQSFSSLQFSYQSHAEEKKDTLHLTVNLYCYFDKNRSWYSANTIENNWLAYQQGRFDICSAIGMQWKDSIIRTHFSAGFYKEELNKLYNTYRLRLMHWIKKYELETNYGSNIEKVEEWKQKIKALNN